MFTSADPSKPHPPFVQTVCLLVAASQSKALKGGGAKMAHCRQTSNGKAASNPRVQEGKCGVEN